MITAKDVKKVLDYDPATGIFRWKSRQNSTVNAGDVAGAIEGNGYRRISINKKLYLAHRLAILVVTGSFPEEQTDHINGDRDDNRYCNLRSVTAIENQRNRKLNVNSTTGVSGIRWRGIRGAWEVSIKNNGKRIHLGTYRDFFEAACARKSAEISHKFHPNHGNMRK